MSKNKLILSCFIITSVLIGLSSCYDYQRLDNTIYISAIGIDKADSENKYKFTFEIVKLLPGQSQDKTESYLIESESETVLDAIQNIMNNTPGEVHAKHCNLIIFGEDVAREGLSNFNDAFFRNSEFQKNTELAVAKNTDAKAILEQEPTSESLVSQDIYNIIKSDNLITSELTSSTINSFNNHIDDELTPSFMPCFSLNDNEFSKYALDGTAIFDRGVLLDYLSLEETRTLLFIINKKGNDSLKVKGADDKYISAQVIKSASSISPKSGEDYVEIEINIETDVTIVQSNDAYDLNSPEGIEKLEADLAENLSQNISKLIHRIKTEYGYDIFRINEAIQRKDMEYWQEIKPDWRENFKEMNVRVNQHITIVNTNISVKSNYLT